MASPTEAGAVLPPSAMFSLQRNAVLLASFPYKYVAYLLPALIRVRAVESSRERDHVEMESMVRVVVDMALAVSAEGFQWSRALKRRLERGASENKLCDVDGSFIFSSDDIPVPMGETNGFNVVLLFNEARVLSPIVRSLTPVSSRESAQGKKLVSRRAARTRRSGDDEDLRQSVRALRRILPGGKRMDVCELICEVESYVTCLELQVGILRSLLGPR